VLVALGCLALVACGGRTTDDAGPGLDASTAIDGGASGRDAGPGPDDGGVADAGGGLDASVQDGGATDAGTSGGDAGSCNPDAVRFEFLASGPLEEGILCDGVIVCVRDAAEAARVMAASSRFQCSGTPQAPCTGETCNYRNPGGPGILDAAELAEICAVTLVSPAPDIACVVYGP
jgi:hypothetical protein